MPKQGVNWQILTTYGKVPLPLFKQLFETFRYDRLFVWINKNTNTALWKYLVKKANAVLITTKGRGRNRAIRAIPYQLGLDWCKERPSYIAQFDEDESWPPHPKFNEYLKKWLESNSEIMFLKPVYFFGDTETITLRKLGSMAYAGFFFKYKPALHWWQYKGFGVPNCKLAEPWKCPYPVPHYSKMTPELRNVYVQQRPEIQKIPDSGRPLKYQVHPKNIPTCKFNPEWTLKDLNILYKKAKK